MNSKRSLPWFRIFLCVAYAAGAVAAVRYELSAQKVLAKAEQLREDHKYMSAAIAYQLLVERYSFSLAVPKAKAAMTGIQPALGESSGERLTTTWLEQEISQKLDPYQVEQLPLVVWPAATVMLLLAFLVRCSRQSGWALLSLLLAAIAGLGSYSLLASFGFVSLEQLRTLERWTRPLLENPQSVYTASCALAVAAAIITLTPADGSVTRPERPVTPGN